VSNLVNERGIAIQVVQEITGHDLTLPSGLRACSRSLLNSANYADAQENVSK
jgi:hypothetical protein